MQAKILPKFRPFYILILIVVLMYSCSDENGSKDYGNLDNKTDTLQFVALSDKVETKLDTMVVVDAQFVTNKIKIEKKFGEQWDFCRCIFANDSLDRLVKNNAELDDKFMKVFDEVDKKCKAFLVMSPNITPEERAAHEKKIKKCLKSRKS